MAIIAKEPESTAPPSPVKPPKPSAKPTPPPQNPFAFWFYFTVSVSLLTFLFVSLSSFSPQDPKTWFLSLSTSLRGHYSNGRMIKVQTSPNHPSIEVFTVQEGPIRSEAVLIVHGLGCSSYSFSKILKSLGLKGARAIALDLPGSGFSDKSMVVLEERQNGALNQLWEIYSEIKEKGIFWGFDQLIENGYVDYEEKKIGVSKVEVARAVELGPEETGKVIGQVIDSYGLAPVNLVLHDSAFGLSTVWVSENLGQLRSVTLLDGTSSETALPLWILQVPVVREIVLGSEFAFRRVIKWCFSKTGTGFDLDAHRILLKGRDGGKAVVGMGKKMNRSFDLAEWGGLDGVKDLPMQVIWSSGWSEHWNKEGQRVANSLPQAKFITYSGARWPQEDTAEELADHIYQFVSSLPKPYKQPEEDTVPEHIHKMFDGERESELHDHGHGYQAGFVNAYGLGNPWAS